MDRQGSLDDVRFTGDHPEPSPPAGSVRVRVRAAALNHLDLWTIRGIPGVSYAFPFVLGGDGAGIIDAVGGDVDPARIGQEVTLCGTVGCGTCARCRAGERMLCRRFQLLGEHVDGTYADAVCVPSDAAHAKPPELSWIEAAASGVVFGTAWRMLVTRAEAREGETCLVHGIGGGLAHAALQLAHALGLRTLATSSSDAKLERATQLGADHVVNYRTGDVKGAVRAAFGAVDIAIDSVGGPTWESTLPLLATGGRIVSCGATGGSEATIDVRPVFWKGLSILGSTMASDADFDAMLAFLVDHDIRPVIDHVVPLDQVPEALAALEAGGTFGKIAVDLTA
jgi:NADPH:quinone reductase-like Zn-dependent oxidoreductase